MRRRKGSVRRVAVRAGLAAVVALATLPLVSEAQTRGAQQRVTPRQGDVEQSRQSRVLLDRFVRRAGQALRLEPEQIRRLQTELQASREARARITARARTVRQELAGLIREPSADEDRIARLLDEASELEVAAAEVARDEQRRLSEFLSPIQRARLIWLRQRLAQEALRRDPPPEGE